MPGIASTPAPVTSGPRALGPVNGRPAFAGRRRGLLRHARIRAKLALILLVPLLAIGALATGRLVDAVGRAVEADLVHALARVAVQAGDLGHELHRERIEAVRLLANPGAEAAAFTRQTVRTDAAAADYQATVSVLPRRVPALATARLAAIDAHLTDLATLRQQILSDPSISISAVLLRYRAMLVDLGAYQATLPAVVTDPDLAEQTRAVAAIAAAGAHAADAEAIARTAAVTGVLTTAQREALRATQTGQREAFTTFGQTADPDQRAIVERAITGANVDTAEAAIAALLDETRAGAAGEPVAAAAAGLAGMVDITRYVGRQLYDHLLDAAAATRSAVLRQVILESVAVTLVLVAAVLVAVLLARMLAAALHRLRAAAVGVARAELPTAVARLSDPVALTDTSPEQLASEIQVPAQLRSRDEIGEVAHALYDVHRTAVQMAAEQAALRTSLSAMFINLARRSQTLVDSMISRLDRLQRNETDADKLQQMMVLDSLATRMRRNDENLLVLAGADSSPPRTRDALIIDVLRAAQSEIEQFHRIEFGMVDDDVLVTAAAVNDVVRLVAELLDNATRFSRPDTAVVCEARRLGHQLVIQVEDRGLGMTPAVTDEVNAMLARPGQLDVATVRKMGLAVVARLAARHQIHVHLQAHPHHGTIATIALPPTVLVLPTGRHHATHPAAIGLPPVPLPTAVPASPERPEAVRPRRAPDVARHHARRRGRDQPSDQLVETTLPLPVLNGHTPSGDPGPSQHHGPSHHHGLSREHGFSIEPGSSMGDGGLRGHGASREHGLPKRVPQAQTPGPPMPPAALPAPRRPLEQTRDRLAAYQAGVRRARLHQSPPLQPENGTP